MLSCSRAQSLAVYTGQLMQEQSAGTIVAQLRYCSGGYYGTVHDGWVDADANLSKFSNIENTMATSLQFTFLAFLELFLSLSSSNVSLSSDPAAAIPLPLTMALCPRRALYGDALQQGPAGPKLPRYSCGPRPCSDGILPYHHILWQRLRGPWREIPMP